MMNSGSGLLKHFFLTLLLFLVFAGIQGQTPALSRKVTLTVANQSVGSVLKTLEETCNVKFSFDPSVIKADRVISFKVTNQPLELLLTKILENPFLSFKEIGNQVVIYADPEKQIPENVPQQQVRPAVVQQPGHVVKPDTVVIYRTDTLRVLQRDTIIQYQTVVMRDTVLKVDTIYKYRTQKPGRKNAPDMTRKNLGRQNFSQNNGWYSGMFYEHQFTGKPVFDALTNTGTTLVKSLDSASKASPLNFSAGLNFGYDYKIIGFQSGITYQRLGENFEYTFFRQTGGYYLTDTVETYYTVAGSDTSWFYITDSSYVGIDYQKYTYKNPNAYRYLSIPAMLKFRFYRGEKVNVYLIGGIEAAFLLDSKALIPKNNDIHDIDWAEPADLKPLLLQWSAGLGSSARISDYLNLFAEVSYKKNLASQLSGAAFNKYFRGVNLRGGIFVRLF